MADTHGIHAIDTGFQRARFDAAWLVLEGGRGAFIDCGTAHSVPRLLAALAPHGLEPADIDWLVLTHVHLDHAGGAGALLRELPGARLVVHPRGARHMIDPSRLWASASGVYGEEEMRRSYGELVPVPAARVVEAADGHVVDLAGRDLVCIETPGHARHHNAIHDPASGTIFSGDTFGIAYPELETARGRFIIPTTSPVEFDPDALHASVERVRALRPRRVHATHFGSLEDIDRLAVDLHEQVDAMVAIARVADAAASPELRHERLLLGLRTLYARRAARHGWSGTPAALEAILGLDIELNAQGLGVWLDRLRRHGK